MILRSLIVVFAALVWHSSNAQILELRNSADAQPISGADVYNERQDLRLNSDEKGRVDIADLLPCDSLFIRHAGFITRTFPIKRVPSDGLVFLDPKVVEMPVFELKAARETPPTGLQKVTSLDVGRIEREQPRTTADLLERSGEIFVQRSQAGGGSPVIRGFEANRILLMIDGVRLNNAIYRSGHLQNAITVDPFLLEKTEVLFGPGALVYGSDALGGVIHFKTRLPELSKDSMMTVHANAAFRLSSATAERVTHVDFSLGGRRFAALTSFTYSDFGDQRMGARRSHGDETWGLVPEFVVREEGQDVIRTNPDPQVIARSGYQQYDLAQKFFWKATDEWEFEWNNQFSTSSDIPRTDRLTQYRDGQLRFAEWHYGPQERLLSALEAEWTPRALLFDRMQAIAAYQRIGEDRITRSFGRDDRFIREETVDVFSLNLDMVKRGDQSILYYGIELSHNEVGSEAFIEDITTGSRVQGPTRYPDGGSQLSTAAAYVTWNHTNARGDVLTLGTRYSHTEASADFVDTTFYRLPFEDVRFDNGALTGSLAYLWKPNSEWDVSPSVSTGFRAPNVDDFGKVFERSGIVIVPSTELRPEYTLNGELRVGHRMFEDRLSWELAGFYTHILDAIVPVDIRLNGEDSLLYEGELARIQQNQNAQEAYIYGGTATIRWAMHRNWNMEATSTYTYGQVANPDQPLAHIPPLFGRVGISYERDGWRADTFVIHNQAKLADRIAPGRTDNADQGLDGEFPQWTTWHVQFGRQWDNGLSIRCFVDNLLDEHFKAFASGISAPGRNFGLTIRWGIGG